MDDDRLAPPLIAGWLEPGASQMSRHQVDVHAPPDRVYEAALGVSLRNMPVVRLLFRLRGIPYRHEMTLREFFSTRPFLILEETSPHEIVFGVAGSTPPRKRTSRSGGRPPSTPDEFRAYTEDGAIRVVTNFRVRPTPTGSILSTETWVEAFGPEAKRGFRMYWTVIGPFSGLIRRMFLEAAKQRAERIP